MKKAAKTAARSKVKRRRATADRAPQATNRRRREDVGILVVSIALPKSYTEGDTKVRDLPERTTLCNRGSICARGTATHGDHQITSVKGIVLLENQGIPADPPAGHTNGRWNGSQWFFDAAHGNEIPHDELASQVGQKMRFVVWITYDNGAKEFANVLFRVGEIGAATDCDG